MVYLSHGNLRNLFRSRYTFIFLLLFSRYFSTVVASSRILASLNRCRQARGSVTTTATCWPSSYLPSLSLSSQHSVPPCLPCQRRCGVCRIDNDLLLSVYSGFWFDVLVSPNLLCRMYQFRVVASPWYSYVLESYQGKYGSHDTFPII